jgi:DNA-binding CsgD family transcriptional regulator
MAKVTPFTRNRPGIREPGDALERCTIRLLRRLRSVKEPIIWVRAIAGSGKSQLLDALKRGHLAPPFPGWVLLDDPSRAALKHALADFVPESAGATHRLVIASRPNSAIDTLLLRQRMYGRIAIIGDGELWVAAEDASADTASAASSHELFAATGGWPMLVAAHLRGRAAEIRALLPSFLEREVLPSIHERKVAALFAALAAPLTESAFADLGGAEPLAPPLLHREGSEWRISGDWTHDALLTLRRSPASMTPLVRERLRGFYASVPAPERAILDLVGMGETDEALEIFKNAGGVFFGYRHGYGALEALLQAFGPQLEQRVEELYLARLWLLIKSGKPREALLKLEERHPGLPVDLRGLRLTHRAEAVLLRLDIALDIDEMPPRDVVASWGRLQSFLPAGDNIALGLLYNSMAIGFLQADALVEARRLAEEALAAYQAAGSEYLVHCMHLHLCDIALRQSRLDDATRLLSLAEGGLQSSGQAFNSELAILCAFRSRIAFEEGRIHEALGEIGPILAALLVGDSWPDLIRRSSVPFVLAGYWSQGLRHAIELLDECALTLSRRHGSGAHRPLALLRIRLMQVARHHAEADMLLEEYDLEVPPWRSESLAVEEGLIRLRQAVVKERPRACIGRLTDALAGNPLLEPRQRISIAILQAAAYDAQGSAALARRYLRVALREAEAKSLVAVLLEDGEFVERLVPDFIAAPGLGNARLAQFAGKQLRLLKSLPTAPMNSKALADVSRQEHRVLSYVADGYTNKQIGRALALSESTVKFHLRSLFKKLGVNTRGALIDAARTRGIRT